MNYTKTRPKGYAAWNPRAETLEVLRHVEDVLTTYTQHWPLTIRQIYYRLVGAYGYDKTDLAYERLCNYLNRARRAEMIPFSAIRDDGWNRVEPICYEKPAEFIQGVIEAAEAFIQNKQTYQPYNVFLLAEAAGMVPQLARVAEPYSVPVMSSGGFDSLTIKYELAQEAKRSDRPTVFLHVGDLDPSGVCIFDSLAADVQAFSNNKANFIRVALLPEHIEQYDLPTAPAKKTDRRNNGVNTTCQAEALPPDILSGIVEKAIHDLYDMVQYEEDCQREIEERKILVKLFSV